MKNVLHILLPLLIAFPVLAVSLPGSQTANEKEKTEIQIPNFPEQPITVRSRDIFKYLVCTPGKDGATRTRVELTYKLYHRELGPNPQLFCFKGNLVNMNKYQTD